MPPRPATATTRHAPGLALALALGLLVGADGCSADRPPPAPAIEFWHTLGPAEATTLLAAARPELAGRAVHARPIPFSRAHPIALAALTSGAGCPDLLRIDATWLPRFAPLLAPPPPALLEAPWLDEARALATVAGGQRAAPQALDGLLALHRRDVVLPAAASLTAWLDHVAALPLTGGARWRLALRADGYWWVPFLRELGGELPAGPSPAGGGGLPSPQAERATEELAARAHALAAPTTTGADTPDEARQFSRGEVLVWLTGSWALATLDEVDRRDLVASPVPHAPRGGQLLVVPACASDVAAGWRLAAALTSNAAELSLARAHGVVPTRGDALAAAPALVQAAYRAVAAGRPLPQGAGVPLLFDDLSPAVAAVLAGDSSAAEAMAGVRQGWARLAAEARP